MRLGLLIYGSLDTLSGGYLYDRRLVEYLHAAGDTVEIISLPWRSYPAHLADNFSYRLPHPMSLRGGRREASQPKQPPPPPHVVATFGKQPPPPPHVVATFGKQPPPPLDLLIQDELNHPSLLAANAKTHPYPVISLVHHLRSSEQRPAWQNFLYRVVEKKYLRSVDGFIYNSRTTKDSVTDLIGDGAPSVIAFPPTDRFGLQVTEDEVIHRAQADELRILFLGNVIERKGLHTLLYAITLLPHRIRLDIVGSLASEPAYARRVHEIASSILPAPGIPSSPITFHSSLDNAPLISLLKSAHLLAVPSSYEGFGIVYLEGMGFGLPAIGASTGAAREIITDGVDGFLIPPGDAASLAERLRRLSEDRALLIRMSLAARERYLRQPSWDQAAASIRRFLAKMVSEFAAANGSPK